MSTAKKILATLLLFPLMFVSALVSGADNTVWVTASQVQVKPGMAPRYEQLVKQVIKAHNIQETDVYWFASTTQFGKGGEYTFARLHRNMATMQARPNTVITDALGEKAAEELMIGINETVESTLNGAWQQRPDFSVQPPDNFNGVNASVFFVKILPGKNAVYEEYMKKSIEASRAQAPNAYFTGYSPNWGARNEYVFVAPLPDLGQLGPPAPNVPQRILAHFGKREGTRILEMRESAVMDQWFTLTVDRPDLSRLPPESMASR